MWLPSDDSAEWLHPWDAQIAVLLVRFLTKNVGVEAQQVLEIGVWKGGFISAILKNHPGVFGVGIDPYPGRPEKPAELQHRLGNLGIASRFRLFRSWKELEAGSLGKFLLIHVDGEHSEKAVIRDLRHARANLVPGGIIVVDDYRHFWFPGIGSAMHSFLAESDFSIVAVTPNKAYLSDSKWNNGAHEMLKSDLEDQLGFEIWWSFNGWDPNPPVRQLPDVRNSRVLLVNQPPERFRLSKTQKILREVFPPLAFRFARRFVQVLAPIRRRAS